MITVELQEQLLTRERELDSWESTRVALENGLAVSKCALGIACLKHDAECAHAKVVRQDYLARICAFSTGYWHSFDYDRVLEEH
jgi:hypothetical protein